jgi:tetratricopeptide (TPR) repeat protein
MVTGLGLFWLARGYVREALMRARAVLEREDESISAEVRAGAYYALSMAQQWWTGFTVSVDDRLKSYESMLRLARQSGSTVWIIRALCHGVSNDTAENLRRSIQDIEEARVLVRQLDDPYLELFVNVRYAMVWLWAGDYDRVLPLLPQNAQRARQLGDDLQLVVTLQHMGIELMYEERYQEALEQALEGLALTQRTGGLHKHAEFYFQLAMAQMMLGMLDEALATSADYIQFAEQSDTLESALLLDALLCASWVAQAAFETDRARDLLLRALRMGNGVAHGDMARLYQLPIIGVSLSRFELHPVATRIFAAVQGFCQRFKADCPRDSIQPFVDRSIAVTRAALGPERYAQIVSDSLELPLRDAWDLALHALESDD